MTIKTINKTIRHQQNHDFDAQRLAALNDEYAEDVIITLRKFNPAVNAIVIFDDCAMLEIGAEIQEVTIKAKPSYADLFTSLLAAVLRGG